MKIKICIYNRYCFKNFFRKNFEHHLEICDLKPINCQYCKKDVIRKEINIHQAIIIHIHIIIIYSTYAMKNLYSVKLVFKHLGKNKC